MISPEKEKNPSPNGGWAERRRAGWCYRGPAQLFSCGRQGRTGRVQRRLPAAAFAFSPEVSFFIGRLEDAAVMNYNREPPVEFHYVKQALGRGGKQLRFLDLTAQLKKVLFVGGPGVGNGRPGRQFRYAINS
jgi:hypothetical protein